MNEKNRLFIKPMKASHNYTAVFDLPRYGIQGLCFSAVLFMWSRSLHQLSLSLNRSVSLSKVCLVFLLRWDQVLLSR